MRFINEEIGTQGGLISFAGVHPDSDEPEAVLEKIKNDGFLGIKLHVRTVSLCDQPILKHPHICP